MSGSARAEALVTAMLLGRDGPADDVAVLVVEVEAAEPFSLELPTEPTQLAVLRDELRPWLRSHGLDEQAVRDVLVAIGEAATNAIEHPRDSTKAVFRVEGRLGDGELVVRVSDSGRWREPSLPTDRGRGPRLHAQARLGRRGRRVGRRDGDRAAAEPARVRLAAAPAVNAREGA